MGHGSGSLHYWHWVGGHLTLIDLDGHGGLLVLVGREGLGLLSGDDGVTGDQLGHNASDGLDTQGKGGNVKEQDVLDLITTCSRRQSRGFASTL